MKEQYYNFKAVANCVFHCILYSMIAETWFSKRIIGTYSEGIPGPLVFLIAGMHGNEKAGIKASEWLLKMLEVEHITQPDFRFKGTLVALTGNVEAVRQGLRYIDRDLNRIWRPTRIRSLLRGDSMPYCHEEGEMLDLIKTMRSIIEQTDATRIVVIDLHTTSAHGGIFAVPSESDQSLALALSIHAPVVKGMIAGIKGAGLQYFDAYPWGIPAAAISFEAGEHQDPQSVYISIAAVINVLRNIGSINPQDVKSRHLQLLKDHSKDLPVLCQLEYIYKIEDPECFSMIPGFTNFQKVTRGTLMAFDHDKPVLCPFDAYLLMPLYQKKGNDGFFLVSKSEEYGFFD